MSNQIKAETQQEYTLILSKMLKDFICAPSYDGMTALELVKDVEDDEARLTTELTLQEALSDVEAEIQDMKQMPQ